MQVVLPPPTPARVGAVEVGLASWYGRPYHGRTTSNGETYDMHALTAAHLRLPFHTMVRVTNVSNGRSVDVRINDRGPFVGNRVIDISRAGAERLGMIQAGTAKVRVEVIASPGMVENPGWRPAATHVAVERTDACDGSRYGVQVGSFRKLSNASGVLEDVSGRFARARIVSAEAQGDRLYRVIVGAASAVEASEMLRQMKTDGMDGFVTRIPADSACLAARAS